MPDLKRRPNERDATRETTRHSARTASTVAPSAVAHPAALPSTAARRESIDLSFLKAAESVGSSTKSSSPYILRAWIFSSALHTLLVCGSLLWIIHCPHPATVVESQLDWTIPEPVQAEKLLDVAQPDKILKISKEPASFAGAPGSLAAGPVRPDMSPGVEGPAFDLATISNSTDWLKDNLAQKVSGGSGGGGGHGDGQGNGGGTPFFGAPTEGERLVFVVDCSGSMRLPHRECGTRLNRVKAELHRVISKFGAEQQFFVVFFSDKSRPMPGRKLQYATREVKAQTLAWVDSMVPEGGTEPRGALRYALKLHPSSIYLLTDGMFDPEVARLLEGLNRAGAFIHTVGIGPHIHQELLERIAHDSGGVFRHVP